MTAAERHDLETPPSIVHDGLPEVLSLTAEQRGAAGRGFGQDHIGIGEPVSLRLALGPHDPDKTAESRRHRVEKVAFEVCHRINRTTPVTTPALVTLALLAVDDRALTLTEIQGVVEYEEAAQ